MRKQKNYQKLISQRYEEIYDTLMIHYFDIWMNSKVFEGNLTDEDNHYIMKSFWDKGTVATWVIKHTDDLGFAPYVAESYNMRNFPVDIRLVNERNVPTTIIPNTTLVVNENVVIGYCNKSHTPIKRNLEMYIRKLAQLELLIENNLALQNIPFLLHSDKANIDKLINMVTRILQGELVLTTDIESVSSELDVLNLGAPLLVKELYDYKNSLNCEILTLMGLNNNNFEKSERLIVDEVNANNQYISANEAINLDEMKEFCERVQQVLNTSLTVSSNYDKIQSEGINEGNSEIETANEGE